jgi:hypothetical protein
MTAIFLSTVRSGGLPHAVEGIGFHMGLKLGLPPIGFQVKGMRRIRGSRKNKGREKKILL